MKKKAVTNPHSCEVNGVQFLGSAGQPIDNAMRYGGDFKSWLEVLEVRALSFHTDTLSLSLSLVEFINGCVMYTIIKIRKYPQ